MESRLTRNENISDLLEEPKPFRHGLKRKSALVEPGEQSLLRNTSAYSRVSPYQNASLRLMVLKST